VVKIATFAKPETVMGHLRKTLTKTFNYMDIIKRITKIELLITIACLLVTVTFPPIGVLIGFIIVLLYILIGKDRKEKLKSIGFKTPSGWVKAIFLCLFFAILIEVSFQTLFNPIIQKLTGSEIDLKAFDGIRGNFHFYLGMLLVGWVAGGFIEEILFRGFLITRISKIFRNVKVGDWFAILTTSVIFGFSHYYQGLNGMITTGLISVILGIIFIKSRNILWYSILTHGFVNAIALTLMWLDLDTFLGGLIFK
jgi:membrane protease YdiL (CAAX protease family)